MKRICLIIHSLGIGGMERVMAQLANNFSKREEVEVHIILIGRKRNIEYELADSIIVHRPSFKFDNSKRAISTIRTIRFLRRTVKEIVPHSVLSFGEYWNNLVLLSLYGLPFPIFISDRSEPDKDLGRVQNFLRDKLYPKSTGYIAQTEEAKAVCLSKGWNNHIKVIGNPIREVSSNGQVEKENIVLTVGRLIKTKHIDQLIQMFSDLNQPDWKLVIVGGDAKRMHLSKDLQRLVSELGVEHSVFLEGEQKAVDRYYNKSKIFAFTSSSEGFPNVIGEAMSAGLPVVSFDCVAGPSELIKDGYTGYLVPLFDRRLFKQKLKELMRDADLRVQFGNNAKEKVKDYSVDRVGELFYGFITDVEDTPVKVDVDEAYYEDHH